MMVAFALVFFPQLAAALASVAVIPAKAGMTIEARE